MDSSQTVDANYVISIGNKKKNPKIKKAWINASNKHTRKNATIIALRRKARARTFIRRIIMVILFGFCVIGFFIQTWTFLRMYCQYPTVVEVSIEDSRNLVFPSISICNNNRFRRSQVCKLDPKIRLCSLKSQTRFKQDEFKTFESDYCQGNFSTQIGHQEKDMILDCLVTPKNSSEFCSNKRMTYFSSPTYFNCYTVNGYDVNDLTTAQSDAELTEMDIFISVEGHEYTEPKTGKGAHVLIHSPDMLPSTETEGLDFTPGVSYSLGIKQLEYSSLEAPYQTRCLKSVKRMFGGQKKMSNKRCLQECEMVKRMELDNCASVSLSYLNLTTCCNSTRGSGREDKQILIDCLGNCRTLCKKMSYDVNVVSYDTTEEELSDYENFRNKNLSHLLIRITIGFDSTELMTYSHKPKYALVEVFSNLGGNVGMWLGTSLWACCGRLEKLGLKVHTRITTWWNKRNKGEMAAQNRIEDVNKY